METVAFVSGNVERCPMKLSVPVSILTVVKQDMIKKYEIAKAKVLGISKSGGFGIYPDG